MSFSVCNAECRPFEFYHPFNECIAIALNEQIIGVRSVMTWSDVISALVRRTAVAVRLQTIRRRLPHAHRGWVRTDSGPHGIRPETNQEYLARLTQWATDRAERRARRMCGRRAESPSEE